MLVLNPNDNQGVRYVLVSWLIEQNMDRKAANLIDQFDENSGVWRYAQALLSYRSIGPDETSACLAHYAQRVNPYVPRFLSDEERPDCDYYSPGSPEEASMFANLLRRSFEETEGAIEWISQDHSQAFRKQASKGRKQRAKLLEKKQAQRRKRK